MSAPGQERLDLLRRCSDRQQDALVSGCLGNRTGPGSRDSNGLLDCPDAGRNQCRVLAVAVPRQAVRNDAALQQGGVDEEIGHEHHGLRCPDVAAQPLGSVGHQGVEGLPAQSVHDRVGFLFGSARCR